MREVSMLASGIDPVKFQTTQCKKNIFAKKKMFHKKNRYM